MRMLDTRSLEFVDIGPITGSYSILSHRWCDGEVSFEEYSLTLHAEEQFSEQAHEVRARPGYAKIRECCTFARSRGAEYLWIDTCCIDRRNSEELLITVYWMWLLYEKADECYVYLNDVRPSPKATVTDFTGFDTSSWFSRSWTLQELLAPSRHVFCTADWRVICVLDRNDIYTEVSPQHQYIGRIASAAHVPVELLYGRARPQHYSVAQRMSWAAHRSATRKEDEAYALIGLFKVCMYPLYGEGPRSFERLQHEIIKSSSDETIFAWRAPTLDSTNESSYHDGPLLAPSTADFQDCRAIISTQTRPNNHLPPKLDKSDVKFHVQFPHRVSRTCGPDAYIMLLECSDQENRDHARPGACALLLLRYNWKATKLFLRLRTVVVEHSIADQMINRLADANSLPKAESIRIALLDTGGVDNWPGNLKQSYSSDETHRSPNGRRIEYLEECSGSAELVRQLEHEVDSLRNRIDQRHQRRMYSDFVKSGKSHRWSKQAALPPPSAGRTRSRLSSRIALPTIDSRQDGPDSTAAKPAKAFPWHPSNEASPSEVMSEKRYISGNNESDLANDFKHLNVDSSAWISELLALGYQRSTIDEVFRDHENDAPWIHFEHWAETERLPQPDKHVDGCVHTGGKVESESRHACADRQVASDRPSGYAQTSSNPSVAPDIDGSATLQDSVAMPVDTIGVMMINAPPEDDRENYAAPEGDEVDIQETVASLCGIAGVSPHTRDHNCWPGPVDFEGQRVAKVSYWRYDSFHIRTSQRFELTNARTALSGFCSAAAEMQERQYCCDTLTVLRRQSATSGSNDCVAELCSMDFKVGTDLLNSLDRSLSGETATSSGEIAIMSDRARYILRTVADDDRNGTFQLEHLDLTTLITLAVQVLCLALLSYCQAHTGPLHPFFLTHGLEEVQLFGCRRSWEDTEPYLILRLEHLTCIGTMLGNRALVFGTLNIEPYPLNVLASPEDIVDTWGPGNFVLSPETSDDRTIDSIVIAGGSIDRVPNRHRWYHWSKEWPKPASELADFAITAREKITVGAGITVNHSCILIERDCLETSCAYLNPLGSWEAYWETLERQTGIQAGQYVNVVYNQVRSKRPGQPLKETHALSPVNEVTALLESPWGLQVSFCSGVTRRVKMRELMADLIPVYVSRMTRLPEGWSKLCNDHDMVNNLQSSNLHQWLSDLSITDEACHILLCALIRAVTTALKDTGIDKDWRHFRIAWMMSDPTVDHQCIVVPTENTSFWTRILKDSSVCATYAYLTLKCLEINGLGCRKSNQLWHSELSLMETEMLRQRGHPGRILVEPWTMQHGEIYAIGPPEGDSRLQLYAHVERPNLGESPRLIVKARGIPHELMVRFLLLRKQQIRIRERSTPFDRVQTVLVASRPTGV